ncbi:MAG: hypothetical protein IJS40_02410 [Synergistaceae bacterium]|nr:hypothetical protein [Synergistaceae bacterium]
MRKFLIFIFAITLISFVALGKIPTISAVNEWQSLGFSGETNYSASYIEMAMLICLGLFLKKK